MMIAVFRLAAVYSSVVILLLDICQCFGEQMTFGRCHCQARTTRRLTALEIHCSVSLDSSRSTCQETLWQVSLWVTGCHSFSLSTCRQTSHQFSRGSRHTAVLQTPWHWTIPVIY